MWKRWPTSSTQELGLFEEEAATLGKLLTLYLILMESSTEESTTAHQPGKSWIVLEEDDGNGLGLPLLMATGQPLKEKTLTNLLFQLLPRMATGQLIKKEDIFLKIIKQSFV